MFRDIEQTVFVIAACGADLCMCMYGLRSGDRTIPFFISQSQYLGGTNNRPSNRHTYYREELNILYVSK